MHTIKVPNDWRYGRIKEDIESGRLWKARDRLSGRLVEDPADQQVLDLLGAVLFEMGDLPQAGRYWYLTERDDDASRAARAAFHERFGASSRLTLAALPRPSRPDRYPPSVRDRLERLTAGDSGRSIEWMWRPEAGEPKVAVPEGHSSRWSGVASVLVTAALVVPFVVGWITVMSWIVGWVS